MDFNFLTDDSLQRRSSGQQTDEFNRPPAAERPPPARNAFTLDIPSYQQVNNAQQQRAAVPNLFRPGLTSHQQTSSAQQPGQLPAGQAASSSYTSPSPAQPSWQHHQQQQQQQTQQQGAAQLLPMAIPQHHQGGAPPGAVPPPGPGSSFARPPAQAQLQVRTAGPAGPLQRPAAAQVAGAAILVSRRQQGNPLLKHVKQVRWQYADIVPDYMVGQHTALLFLSIRYHLLHPDYILKRLKELQHSWRVVLLVHVDVEDMVRPLGDISRAAVLNEATLVCAWSNEECARWLETLKSYESKSAAGIQEHVEADYSSRLAAALTSVRGVNRTDATTLGSTFGCLADILRADVGQLSACPGIGPTKVRRLFDAFNEPFRKPARAAAQAQAQGGQAGSSAAGGGGGGAAGAAAAQQQQQQHAGGGPTAVALGPTAGEIAELIDGGDDELAEDEYDGSDGEFEELLDQ